MAQQVLTESWAGVLTPAYGRDYKSMKEVLADFNANKDFQIHMPTQVTYINKEQIAAGVKLQVRYAKQRKVGVVEVKR